MKNTLERNQPAPPDTLPPPLHLLRDTALLCLLFGCLCLPLILSTRECNYSQDESSFHLPAIRQIASHWPALDIAKDSLSATAPGYHYFLATVSLVTGQSILALRLVNWAVSAAVLVVLFGHLRRHLACLDATLALLPLAFSNFFVKSASWVVTDNVALLLVTLCILSCLRQRTTTGQSWGESLLIAAAVFVRQMAIWLVALPLAAAIASPLEERRRKIVRAGLCALPPLAVLVVLIYHWSGLVPPAWREAAVMLSTAGPVYLLSTFAIFSLVYLPSGFPARTRSILLISAAMAGLALSLIQPTAPDYSAGRWGGYLWNLATHVPSLAARNSLFIVLCPLGAVAAARIWRGLSATGNRQAATVFIVGLAAWAATFTLNRQAFHRYFEPTILVLLIALTPALVQGVTTLRRWRIALALCSAVQLGITLATAHLAVLR